MSDVRRHSPRGERGATVIAGVLKRQMVEAGTVGADHVVATDDGHRDRESSTARCGGGYGRWKNRRETGSRRSSREGCLLRFSESRRTPQTTPL